MNRASADAGEPRSSDADRASRDDRDAFKRTLERDTAVQGESEGESEDQSAPMPDARPVNPTQRDRSKPEQPE